jgi:hypothetical protein
VLVLNSYTRWGHGELMEMAVEDLAAWLETVREVYRSK